MLRDEIAKYTELSGNDGWHTPIGVIGAYLDGYEKGKGEWIPVSKRLPDEEHEVYCQLSDGSNAVLYVQDNWGQMEWVDGMMGTGTYDVVAWMEKPEPYKADREVNE